MREENGKAQKCLIIMKIWKYLVTNIAFLSGAKVQNFVLECTLVCSQNRCSQFLIMFEMQLENHIYQIRSESVYRYSPLT